MSLLQIIRLVSNEEVVANVEFISGDKVRLSDIAAIVPTKSGSIQLMPYIPYAKEDYTITITNERVFFMADPHPDLAKLHSEMFSKIMVPQKQKIVLH